MSRSAEEVQKGLEAAAQLSLPLIETDGAEAQMQGKSPLPEEAAAQFLELFPFALSMTSVKSRPILVFKDETKEEVLPVWLNPVDTGVMLASDLSPSMTTPHAVTKKIFAEMGISLEKCVFVELNGHHQYVELHFRGHPTVTTVKCRAEDAILLCLNMQARFYSTPQYMRRCRELDAEMVRVEKGLLRRPEIGSKKHPYMM